MVNDSKRDPARNGLPLQEFIHTEVLSGLILFTAAIAALIWVNSPLDDEYFDFFGSHITVDGGIFRIDESIQHWINDALMTLFFFVVGLEIKRELYSGELAGVQKALLPVAAAAGGMVAPALIYTAINAGGGGQDGWGIPMATDIAFALGVLALVGTRIPSPVRAFLLALAIVDDIGAILVIAVFYSESLSIESLGIALGLLVAIGALVHFGIRSPAIYAVLAVAIWIATYESGVHATLAGVALGLLAPVGPTMAGESYLERLEDALHPLTSFLIVPLFALANAGVVLTGDKVSDALSSEVALGVAAGLLIGKPLGIFGATWLAVRLRLARLPDAMNWQHVAGVGIVGGVGFTVALFINELAFDRADLVDDGKMGILAGSLVSAVAGFLVLRLATRPVNETR